MGQIFKLKKPSQVNEAHDVNKKNKAKKKKKKSTCSGSFLADWTILV
jgi:hypothetical protein